MVVVKYLNEIFMYMLKVQAPKKKTFNILNLILCLGSNPYSKFNRLTAPVIIISILLLIVMLIVLIIFGIKYCKITKNVY